MKSYIHATIASTFAWAGNIYDLTILTYVYSYFSTHYGLNYLTFSLLFSLGLIGRAVGGSVFGNLADRVGRKPVLMIGTGGYATLQIALALSPNAFSLFVFRLFQGVFMEAQWTAGTVIAYENAPVSLRGIVTGIVQSGYGIGYSLTGFSYILLYNDPRLFLLTGAIPLILLPYIKGVKESKIKNSFYIKPTVKDYIPLLFKATLGMSGMFLAYFAVFGNYETIALEYLHMSNQALGLIMLIANIGLAFSFIMFGRLADFLDKRKLIYIGVIGMLIFLAFAIPSIIVSTLTSEIGVIGFAFSTGFWPLMPLLLAEAVPMEVRGLLSGLSYNIGGFVGGIGSIVLGFIEIIFGIRGLMFGIDGFGIAALALVLISVITWPKGGRATQVMISSSS